MNVANNNCGQMLSDSSESSEPPRAQAGAVFGKKDKGKKADTKKKNTATEGSKRVKKEKKKDDGEAAKGDPTNKTNMTPAPPQTHPIVEQWVLRALDVGVDKLREEFRGLAKYTRPDMTQVMFNANQSPDIAITKNRYQDVPCQDQSAVKLDQPSPCNYIHANYVGCPMIPEKRFICAQGPLDQTIDEFWWMVIQNKVEQIVMLCKTVEMGKLKCAQYWPAAQGEKLTLKSGCVVENVSGSKPMERDPEIQITMLNLTYSGGQTMSVRHLQWTEWPDRGVPPCKLTSLELLSAIRGSKVPIVVHCSAGIGRTGTIVAIEYILEKIAENKPCPPMPELVKALRDQRAFSIQNDVQYLFIHRVMLNYFLEKYKEKYAALLTAENVAKYDKFIKDYNAAVGQ
ncbi:Protein-tyrosine phosphatase [Caenorhabditis elegans]|uniref:Protein-tyrosine phosphatase n=1 Tax=Caenorhabditis elegans TaxID=6239 RepID=O44448_CAEEL|nr:Protein-tyrosine phosphatase [Caenorhabditis elegans]CCD61168.1 Protein-tyrosine phosphatase [Caenorhabditis elegans]|eukprot:NP_500718.1 Tyrosine-protein phosphatase [Caenorhabditis elegans]